MDEDDIHARPFLEAPDAMPDGLPRMGHHLEAQAVQVAAGRAWTGQGLRQGFQPAVERRHECIQPRADPAAHLGPCQGFIPTRHHEDRIALQLGDFQGEFDLGDHR
ncbi:MAG TPA: hypothetical protein VF768_03720, partial [Holophagaceae bacterium]